MLTVPGALFQVQGADGESDEYIEKVNRDNIITRLKECKYLHIIIPGTKLQRIHEAKVDDPEHRYFDEEMEVKKRMKANEKFMANLEKKMNWKPLERETKVVKTIPELKDAVTNFVMENKSAYNRLLITLNCHGGFERDISIGDRSYQEHGTLITHGEPFRTDDYIQLLNELSHDNSIPIETLMGQCYSHLNDKDSVSLQGNVTIHATTTADKPESTLTMDPQWEFSSKYNTNLVTDVLKAEHLGFTKFVREQPQTNPNPFPNQAAGKGPGQVPVGLVAGGGMDIQPGVCGGDSRDMDTS